MPSCRLLVIYTVHKIGEILVHASLQTLFCNSRRGITVTHVSVNWLSAFSACYHVPSLVIFSHTLFLPFLQSDVMWSCDILRCTNSNAIQREGYSARGMFLYVRTCRSISDVLFLPWNHAFSCWATLHNIPYPFTDFLVVLKNRV
jgi:hypothetical protein